MDKLPLLLIFLGHIWVDTSQGVLPVVAASLKELFTLSYFQVGLMTMVLNLTSSVIQPVFGLISDRVRSGWFVPVGILWTAVCMGLLGWAPNFPTALALVGLAGFGTAAFHPRAMMAVSLASGARRGFGTAVFSTGGNVGFALGPIVGSLLILHLGLHATVGLLVPGILLCLVIQFHPGDFLKRQTGPTNRKRGVQASSRRRVPWRSLTSVCGIVTLRSWAYMSFIAYLPLYLKTRGIPLAMGSAMLTVFLAGGAAAGLFGGHLSDRVGRKAVIIGSLLLYPVFACSMMLSSGPWVWLFAGAAGAALLASFSVAIVLAQDLLPDNLGLASGLTLGLGFGTGGLGAALTGYIADHAGLTTAMWILAIVPAAGALLALFVRTRPEIHRDALWSRKECVEGISAGGE